MKQVLFTIMLMSLAATESIHAQTEDYAAKSMLGNFSLGLDVQTSSRHHGVGEWSGAVSASYTFMRNVYTLVHYEQGQATQTTAGARSYVNTKALGAGLGYKVLSIGSGTMDIQAKVLSHIGNSEWKKTSFCAGIQWTIRSGISPTMRLEYRHNTSHTAAIPSSNVVCASVGIKF